ncbi:MAG: hypothetical protein EBR82_60910 [Caulobacteraceae bacterium]|nr:hypothetical protein [Caulobacteraceae bacterium]
MAKGLVLDLETSYILAHTFSLYPDSISHNNIVEDWRIHCAAWKWVGQKKVYTATEKDRDDFGVVAKVAEAIKKADYLIIHNGIKFDMKKLNARIIYHRLPPIPALPVVDTLREARACAAFTSNRLDYIGEYLNVGRKLHNSPGLWTKAFNGDRKSLREMSLYNVQDVLLLEDVYNEIRPYMKKHPNVALIDGSDGCPSCGSPYYEKRGFVHSRTTTKQRYKCNSCGTWFTDKKALAIADKR